MPTTVEVVTVALAVVAAVAVLLAGYAARDGHRARSALTASRAETEQLRAEIEQLRARDAASRAENDELRAQAAHRAADLDVLRQDADVLRQERDTLRGEREQLRVETEQLRAETEQHRSEVEQVHAQDASFTAARDDDRVGRAPAAQSTVLWGLERVRLAREWHDLAGATVPLPVSWEDPVAAALAIELELIRESIGTPSRFEVATELSSGSVATELSNGPVATELSSGSAVSRGSEAATTTPSRVKVAGAAEGAGAGTGVGAGTGAQEGGADTAATDRDIPRSTGSRVSDVISVDGRSSVSPGSGDALGARWSSDPLRSVAIVHVVVELLRRLAHVGEELLVRVGPSVVAVTVAVEPGTSCPDLGELVQLARAAGALVETTVADEALQVTVELA